MKVRSFKHKRFSFVGFVIYSHHEGSLNVEKDRDLPKYSDLELDH